MTDALRSTELAHRESTDLAAELGISTAGMSPVLRIMMDEHLFQRAQRMANIMAQAEGFLPAHIVGKTGACFAVLTRAITWRLDPYAVAQCTYQTPGGGVGYFGKLVQAILENSGWVEGPVRHEWNGPWENVEGKFDIATSDKGKEYAKRGWTRKDAKGCSVTITAKVKGEAEPRKLVFNLDQAFPLNSTLWATDPKTQIVYAAVRRFADTVAPGLMMGTPWDGEIGGPQDYDIDGTATVVSSKEPTRADFKETKKPEPKKSAGSGSGATGDKGQVPASTDNKTPQQGQSAADTSQPIIDVRETQTTVFSIFANDTGEADWTGDDIGDFSSLLLSEAKRLSVHKDALDRLWDLNSPQFQRLPSEAAQAIRDSWPKYEASKPAQPAIGGDPEGKHRPDPPRIAEESLAGLQPSPKSQATAAPIAPKAGEVAQQPQQAQNAPAPATAKPAAASADQLAIIDNHGEVVWEGPWDGQNQQTFAGKLLELAKTVSHDKALLNGLWETNEAAVKRCRPVISQTIEKRWPKFTPAPEPESPMPRERLV